jgi:hypothetical protein
VKEKESLACSLVPLVQVVNQRQLGQLDVVPAERKIKIQVFTHGKCWGSGFGAGSARFWASRIRILPFTHKGVERTEIILGK